MVTSNLEFRKPEVVEITEARGPKGTRKPFRQLVGRLGCGIGIGKGFLTMAAILLIGIKVPELFMFQSYAPTQEIF